MVVDDRRCGVSLGEILVWMFNVGSTTSKLLCWCGWVLMHFEKSFWATRIASSAEGGRKREKRRSWQSYMQGLEDKRVPLGEISVFFFRLSREMPLSPVYQPRNTEATTSARQRLLLFGLLYQLQVHRTAEVNTSHGSKPHGLGLLPGIPPSQRRPPALAPVHLPGQQHLCSSE
jgi:hypothetical protein